MKHLYIKFLLYGSLFVFLFFWTSPDFSTKGTIKIYDRNNRLLYEEAGSIGARSPVVFEKIPTHLIDAVISSEDATFWNNHGIDFAAILRALRDNIREQKVVSGASTITQQLARISVIAPFGTYKRTVVRKIREMAIAIRLNATYTKKEILTRYLNAVYFGNMSYGISAAARTYFDKDVSVLSLGESALLAGLISSPETRNPFGNLPAAKAHQKFVLDQMVRNKTISSEQAEIGYSEPLNFHTPQDLRIAPHAVSYVLSTLADMNIKNTHGLRIMTTLDSPLTSLAQDIARQQIYALSYEHAVTNASLVYLDNINGAIRVMLGGIDYFDATNSGQINMTTALRQPGSALKPVTYAAGFKNGMTPATVLYDVATVYKTKKGEGFTPNNYDGRYHGLVSVRDALASSLNLPAVEVLHRVGIPALVSTARALGITTFTHTDQYDLSLTLGGGEVTLLDLTNVFAGFARGGSYISPYVIERIESDDARILYSHIPQKPVPALGAKSREISYLISDILSDPKARMLGFSEKNPLVLSRPAAVKTGTTTDWHDNWTIGYTPTYSVGVWVGNNDNRPMRDISGVFGAAPIWHQFFEEVLQTTQGETFVRPDGIVSREICTTTGLPPDTLCPTRKNEIFIAGTEPSNTTSQYKTVRIDKRNGLLADADCSSTFVELKTFLDYPKEVYSWAVEHNQPIIPRDFSPLCPQQQSNETQSYLTITYPKEKAVFETAPEFVSNETLVFEAAYSSSIRSVSWMVDGNMISKESTAPFHGAWKPSVGKHAIKAIGETNNGKNVTSNTVSIMVVGYTGTPH